MKLSKRLRPLLKHKEHITYLTSLLYPIDTLEVFHAACCMDSTNPATISTALVTNKSNDNFAATAAVSSAVMRDALNTFVALPENCTATATINSAVLKTLLNAINTNDGEVEAVMAAAGINLVSVSDALIKNNAQTEPVIAMAAIDKAILG